MASPGTFRQDVPRPARWRGTGVRTAPPGYAKLSSGGTPWAVSAAVAADAGPGSVVAEGPFSPAPVIAPLPGRPLLAVRQQRVGQCPGDGHERTPQRLGAVGSQERLDTGGCPLLRGRRDLGPAAGRGRGRFLHTRRGADSHRPGCHRHPWPLHPRRRRQTRLRPRSRSHRAGPRSVTSRPPAPRGSSEHPARLVLEQLRPVVPVRVRRRARGVDGGQGPDHRLGDLGVQGVRQFVGE